ncbi:MAG: DNA mismatch repair endonuclease MutL [Candidatus Azobacteroides pseudotrichonymphae]|nr:MAG: DNA mismatch repair endonuclease MutL [Candidatus Azobacteroides pseudotrichonymphae]
MLSDILFLFFLKESGPKLTNFSISISMDIIHLLPDSIANQIAAGEVIQRPASVVKELIENAVDAAADNIQIIIKDAGRSLIQVIDNGQGMSKTDARLSFERHATSKIHSAKDLFALRTMGFRGEALASISAVAQVELKTRRKEDEIGIFIRISASKVEKQETVAIHSGSSFSVKNLFYNIPARRKFLKSNEIEFKNILVEFERVALVNPQITFTLRHNSREIISLPISNLKQRITNLMGGKIAQNLLPININTSFIQIYGFISVPTASKKRGALQYFFANGRYMRHAYFHRAVILAFEPFIPIGDHPNYFLYIKIDPASIDINIHPTKTEIKFENEQMLFQIIFSAVKEAIAVPTLEFDQEKVIDIPSYRGKEIQITPPIIQMHSDYNPFSDKYVYENSQINWKQSCLKNQTNNTEGTAERIKTTYLQYKGKYLILSLKSGIIFIDQRRAHIRILFDDYIKRINHKQGISQRLLFPEKISFTPKEITILPYILDDLAFIGFDLKDLGNNIYSINGIPAGSENIDIIATLQEIIDKILTTSCEIKEEITESLVLVLAQKTAINYGISFSEEEIHTLIARLFSSTSPKYTPDGKLIIFMLSEEELNKRFL